MSKILQCHICNEINDKGIILLNKYICRKCELKLIDCLDEFNYEKMRREIKNIWKGVTINNVVENF